MVVKKISSISQSSLPMRTGVLGCVFGNCGSVAAAPQELAPCPQRTLSLSPSCCRCARNCWPKMMWLCHISSSICRCYRLNGFSLLRRVPLSTGASVRLLLQPVGDWLELVGLPQYESKLLLNGFDDLHYMVSACSCKFSFHIQLCCFWALVLCQHRDIAIHFLQVQTESL